MGLERQIPTITQRGRGGHNRPEASGLTLYVVNDNPTTLQIRRLVDSLGEPLNQVVFIKATEWHTIKERKNDWYTIMYPREFLDERLTAALPMYLDSEYDYLCPFKFARLEQDPRMRVSVCARFFRKFVRVEEGHLKPSNAHKLKGVRMLDGWILERK
jgi:hypothetical protein